VPGYRGIIVRRFSISIPPAMPSFISRLLGRRADAKPVRGLVFASASGDAAWADAAPGRVIRGAAAGPPWIVVCHGIQHVLGAGWPGRLWEVEILEAAADQPLEGAGYTRAVAVRVLRELPVAMMFGAHGDDVLRVIARAASLEPGEAAALASRTTAAAREAYSRAWNAWLTLMKPDSIHLGTDHANTLAVPSAGTDSPIGHGFMIIYQALNLRARDVAGDAAFEVDGEGEVLFAPPWSGASWALLDAAMALARRS
jgi:hypothetical protein